MSSLAVPAMAQQVPVRIVQGTDGVLFVVQGGKSWTLVPDQLSDSDLAQLSPTGEIDGILPDELFVVVQAAPALPRPRHSHPLRHRLRHRHPLQRRRRRLSRHRLRVPPIWHSS